ncbi:uncharacterized protein AKAME5_002529200 [Lates japonicus]|uniref:Uncharacterized protein n=1 Tax=Lates japonicus TaxID=270547 RepID=A0AAD3RMK1_LATJO|nr:uncharacterized protein AKAME5_002529200 [Lates japonicus]
MGKANLPGERERERERERESSVFYQSCNIIALELTVKERNSKGPQEQDRASSLLGRSPGVIIIYGRSDAPHSCLLLPPS